VREEWRVVDRWWTEKPVRRHYFEVVLENGRNVVVFLDELDDRWYRQSA
jgi:Cdc6-like AAA superfamily ATPase